MGHVLLAVAPVFALILAGRLLERMRFPGPGFWPLSESLTYYVLLPALLVRGLSGRTMSPEYWILVFSLALAVLAMAVLLVLIRPLLRLSDPAFTSVFQGAIRPNTYIALSLAEALLGPDWMALSAAALLTLIPLVNVLSVACLTRFGSGRSGGWSRPLLEIARNPLILASAAGMVMNVMGLGLPRLADATLGILGQAALPMGLLAVGAGLRPADTKSHATPALLSSGLHLLALPVLAWTATGILQAPDAIQMTAILFTAVPVSVSSFILARQMGGDHEAMAAIITTQTILALGTLSPILYFLE
ncbi:MAG: AEC family transporter [Deltaproteobacteria bacterium]|nr:AEC family transporter [Deltaproteobacteria bacterium]